MKFLYLSLIALGIIFIFSTSAYALPFPVLYMKSNTIGHIYVEYSTGHHNQTIKLGPMDIYDANLTNHVPLNFTDLSVIPNSTSITLDSNSAIVDYTVTAKNNLNGVYALPVEHFTDRSSVVWDDPLKKTIRGYSKALCYMIPLSIGLNSSQVNQDTLDKFVFFNASENCPVPLVDRWYAGSQTIERMPGSYITGVKLIDEPLKQYEAGIAAKNVTCKQEYQLIFKSEDSSPACVKPNTAQLLIERSWGHFP